MTWSKNDVTEKLFQINTPYIRNLKANWFAHGHPVVNYNNFIPQADEWFKSTKLNQLHGWGDYPCIDVILGCTHFFESLIIKHGWNGVQILPGEYAYYGLMGKHGTEVGSLLPNVPLIISLPNWKYADIHPQWADILTECQAKNIDIHIDMAWFTAARDIQLDVAHPCIKSFAMSFSKYSMEWNRVGLRWSRQRTMDSVTIFNKFTCDANTALTSGGSYIMNNLDRDYGWNTLGELHYKVCADLDLRPSKIIHVAHAKDNGQVLGIGNILNKLA